MLIALNTIIMAHYITLSHFTDVDVPLDVQNPILDMCDGN